MYLYVSLQKNHENRKQVSHLLQNVSRRRIGQLPHLPLGDLITFRKFQLLFTHKKSIHFLETKQFRLIEIVSFILPEQRFPANQATHSLFLFLFSGFVILLYLQIYHISRNLQQEIQRYIQKKKQNKININNISNDGNTA